MNILQSFAESCVKNVIELNGFIKSYELDNGKTIVYQNIDGTKLIEIYFSLKLNKPEIKGRLWDWWLYSKNINLTHTVELNNKFTLSNETKEKVNKVWNELVTTNGGKNESTNRWITKQN